MFHNSKTKHAREMLLQDFDNYDMDCKSVKFGENMKCFRAAFRALIGPHFWVQQCRFWVMLCGSMFGCFLRAQNGKLSTHTHFLMLRSVLKIMVHCSALLLWVVYECFGWPKRGKTTSSLPPLIVKKFWRLTQKINHSHLLTLRVSFLWTLYTAGLVW